MASLPTILSCILIGLFAIISNVECHGSMVMPINWFDLKMPFGTGKKVTYEYIGMKSGMQCYAGGQLDRKAVCPTLEGGCAMPHPGASCFWYKNHTRFPDVPTIFDPKLRTFGINEKYSYYHHPWRYPGKAPIDSPCGVAGGNVNGCGPDKCNVQQGGYGFGMKAEQFRFPIEPYVTKWKRGDVVEVAWAITANHGGGYSYRLCKVPKEGVSALTEECFQKTHLDFVGDMQWVQYGEDESTRVGFPATRIRQGTFPAGSHWTKNPIPACMGNLGGFLSHTKECPKGTQFPPPKPYLYGFGTNVYGTIDNFKFSIIDKVKIPDNLPSGDYVLSFRWDCEQTHQVWNTCASIQLN